MIELFPCGFEEREGEGELELAAYGDSGAAERLARAVGPVVTERVEPGWEDRWKEFHRPVRSGRLWIGPSWEQPDDDALVVVIDPGRAFGTGAHPTTRLCLEFLDRIEPGSLLDLGSGSGVVAVAAAKLGFAPVVAVDLDPVAVEATRSNAGVNLVAVETLRADVLVDPLPDVDVAVANIALATVEAIAARVRAQVLVASGYLADERPAAKGWRTVERLVSEGWAADLLERL
jgi:ribosomal protein L11 methyltransferase